MFKCGFSGQAAPPRTQPAVLRLVTSKIVDVEVKVRPTAKESDDPLVGLLPGESEFTHSAGIHDRQGESDEELRDVWATAPRTIEVCLSEVKVLPEVAAEALQKFNENENRRAHPRGVWVRG